MQKQASGRPRSELSKAAILKSAFELLRELGYERMSIEAIASRAGVGKTTIYRWWQSKDEIILEVLSKSCHEIEVPDTGSLSKDLALIIANKLDQDPCAFDRQTCALTVSAISASKELSRAYWDNYITPRRNSLQRVFDRAIARGELESGIDTNKFFDIMHGALLFMILLKPEDQDIAAYVQSTVDQMLRGFTPRESNSNRELRDGK
ncbi:MAG: TetR/AcrR family transcriptional regulator [Candidatus Obscuribacterales bacterium]|nr:TetR/AcrR family transcriptional regulator [Candidatus Obscuribacterales bacterium]